MRMQSSEGLSEMGDTLSGCFSCVILKFLLRETSLSFHYRAA